MIEKFNYSYKTTTISDILIKCAIEVMRYLV